MNAAVAFCAEPDEIFEMIPATVLNLNDVMNR